MTSHHFGDLVANFDKHGNELATTTRRFLKIERLRYRDLHRLTHQAANYPLAREVAVGDRIVVVANNSPEWVELFLATQLIGAILVPTDVRAGPATTLKFIEQTEPKLIFRNKHLHPELDRLSTVEFLDDLKERVCGYPDTAPGVDLHGDYAAVIVFTSGTTADPKGVVLTQKNLLANAEDALRVVDVRPDWWFLSVLPLSHMYELTGGTLCPLLSGASIFYVPSTSPHTIGRAMQDYRITTMLAIPQFLILMLGRVRQAAAAEGKAATLARGLKLAAVLPFPLRRLLFRDVHAQLGGRLNLVVTGGAPIPADVGVAWERMGVRILEGYGLTETGPILTMNPLHGGRIGSAGRALDGVRLRIAQDNEVQAKGDSIFREYWRNPSASRGAFTEDGWFRTGDAGSLRHGWLQIQGRLKFAIVLSSGLKVFPEDVELVAGTVFGSQAVCVVGVKRPGGEEVVAVVVSDRPDGEIGQEIDEINTRLESFQHIGTWRRWPEARFPLTRLLKIDRRKVQDWANQTGPEAQAQKGDEPSEDEIVSLVRRGLDEPRREVKDSDRLADIGLDSLRRLTVVALIEDELGVAIPEEDVTQTTTVADLRRLVAAGSPAERPIPRPSWPFRRSVRLFGDLARDAVLGGIVRIWVRTSVQGQENLDQVRGPALYIFNHTDDFDGPVIYRALPRRIRKRVTVAAADDVLHEHRLLGLYHTVLLRRLQSSPYRAVYAQFGICGDIG